jgi:deoxyribodipyrimidine photo-lyase
VGKRAICWFRRDLRVHDNLALYNAAGDFGEVVPVFVFEDCILERLLPGDMRVAFLLLATGRLDAMLRERGSYLIVVKGRAEHLVPELIRMFQADAVYVNRGYGSRTVKRDNRIKEFCARHGVAFREFDDTLLVPPDMLPARKVFSPFFKLWIQAPKGESVVEPARLRSPSVPQEVQVMANEGLRELERDAASVLERVRGLWDLEFPRRRFKEFDFQRYPVTHDLPAMDGTSRLSVYIRFGIVSIREVFRHVSSLPFDASSFISELAWREFWYHVMHHFPETRELEFQKKRRGIKWLNNESWYEAWREGRTGYPIVDAGMRQLKEEGWMHGRVRMVVASFLTKDLLVDWRWGDRHFFHHLMDYDEAVDIGNWQWSASVGADPKPMRIFNPLLQSRRFDPQCLYIKSYIPELRGVPPHMIHDPLSHDLGYARPIVNHFEMSLLAKRLYTSAGS